MVVSLLPEEKVEFALNMGRELLEVVDEFWLIGALVTAIAACEEIDVVDDLEV